MPSGYVYLGQFIDHDITRDGRFVVDEAGPDAEKTPNYRSPTLDLDTIYGKRDSVPPNITEGSDELPLGNTLEARHEGAYFPSRPDDLPRDASDGTAEIIDPRNDENLVIAQMQVLFTKFHNYALRLLRDHPELSASPAGTPAFEQARRFVIWHYQWIVRYDFLPNLVRTAVLEEINSNGPLLFDRMWYTPADYPMRLPIEFTVAAFRFGHSMIQESYRLHSSMGVKTKELLAMTKWGGGICKDTPALPASYVIDWDFFFTAPEAVLNRGQNIDPFITEALYKLPPETVAKFRMNLSRSLPAFHRDELMRPLPELTLRRGSKMLLPSGEEFADHFGFPRLEDLGEISGLPEFHEIFDQAEFQNRTPLWYYLLREAELEHLRNPEPAQPPAPPMQKLGTVGSHIIAEVLLQILASDRYSISNADRTWTPPKFVFGESGVPRSIDSMPKLVDFVRSYETGLP
jgi:hypothetical protein